MDKSPKITRFSDLQTIPKSGPMTDTFSGIANLKKKDFPQKNFWPGFFQTLSEWGETYLILILA